MIDFLAWSGSGAVVGSFATILFNYVRNRKVDKQKEKSLADSKLEKKRIRQMEAVRSVLGETLEEMQLISKPHEVDKLVSSEEDFSEISKTLVQKYRFRVKSELAKADPFVCDPSVRESFDKIKEAVSDEWYGDFLFVVDFATERNDAEGVIRTFSEYLAKVAAITNEALSKAVEALDSDGFPLTELESGPEVVEKGQTESPLTGRARNYSCINRLVALCGFFIFVIEVCHMFASPAGSAEQFGSGFAALLALVGFAVFLTRSCWMRRASKCGYQVTDNPDDYSLERTTFFAWVLLAIVLFIEALTPISLSDLGIKTVGGWIIALAFWTPIVNVIGSGWGKLKATKTNGDKIVWPCSWGMNSDVKR